VSGKFASQVEAFADKSKRRQLAIFRESVQRVSHESNTPQAQGGKMPVDTGFLRNSQGASLTGLPATGAQPVELVLLTTKVGDTIWVGWTAEYAKYMEARYAFMRSAAQNWQFIVKRVTEEVKTRFP
jgi:hypothetical protein